MLRYFKPRFYFSLQQIVFFFPTFPFALLPVTADDPAADRAGHLSRRHRLSDTRWQVHRSAFQSPAALHPALLLHLPPDTYSPSLLHPPVKLALAPSRRRTRTDHRTHSRHMHLLYRASSRASSGTEFRLLFSLSSIF